MILISRYESNLEALSETVQKKASVGRFHGDISIYYPKHR